MKKLIQTLAILAPSVALSALTALAPALASIGRAFPELSDVAIQNIYTVPYLVAFPLIYCSGILASIFTKKQILAASLVTMILGGCLPLFFHGSYAMLLLSSVIIGIGFGTLSPMTSALIHEHCPPEQQAWMLGVQSAVIGIGGMAFASLAGKLASIHWWLTYAAFLILVPSLALTLCLPKGIITPRPQIKDKLLSAELVYILVFGALLQAFTNSFQTNISMLVEEFGFGGAETAGRVTSFYSFAGIIGGLLTGTIISRLGRRVMPGISAVFAMGMLLMWQGSSMPALLIGTFITGMFVSVRMPAGYLSATEIAPAQATMMISLYCCAAQFGVFLSPYILKLISPDDTTAARFLACGAALAVMAVVGFIKTGRKTEK